jgi:hypothetical protein
MVIRRARTASNASCAYPARIQISSAKTTLTFKNPTNLQALSFEQIHMYFGLASAAKPLPHNGRQKSVHIRYLKKPLAEFARFDGQ